MNDPRKEQWERDRGKPDEGHSAVVIPHESVEASLLNQKAIDDLEDQEGELDGPDLAMPLEDLIGDFAKRKD